MNSTPTSRFDLPRCRQNITGAMVEVTPHLPASSAVAVKEGMVSQSASAGSAEGAHGESRLDPPIPRACIQDDQKAMSNNGNRPELSQSALPPRARPPAAGACKDHGTRTPKLGEAPLKMRLQGGSEHGGIGASTRADGKSSDIRNAVGAGGDSSGGGGGGGSVGAVPGGDARTGPGPSPGPGVGSRAGSASGLAYRPRMKSMSGLEGNSEKVSRYVDHKSRRRAFFLWKVQAASPCTSLAL